MRRVLALHFTSKCNLRCPFCYERGEWKELPERFWLGLVPHLRGRFSQVALGGGEPLLRMGFVERFVRACHREGMPVSLTTNGRLRRRLERAVEVADLVSVSYDSYKWGDPMRFLRTVSGLKVGVNLMLESPRSLLTALVFSELLDSVFLILRKPLQPWVARNLETIRRGVRALSEQGNVFVDDSLRQVVRFGLGRWEEPCHFGRGIVSIQPDGTITGCSFDREPLTVLRSPEDIEKLDSLRVPERFHCPHFLEVNHATADLLGGGLPAGRKEAQGTH